jgi:hypothetical protein
MVAIAMFDGLLTARSRGRAFTAVSAFPPYYMLIILQEGVICTCDFTAAAAVRGVINKIKMIECIQMVGNDKMILKSEEYFFNDNLFIYFITIDFM